MKKIKLAAGVALLGVGNVIAFFFFYWIFVVVRHGSPTGRNLVTFFFQCGLFIVLAIITVAGGVALLREAAARPTAGPPRRKFTWEEVEKILLVGNPRGSLLALMDADAICAEEILDRAYRGQSQRRTLRAALDCRSAAANEIDLQQAVGEAFSLYRHE